MSLAQLGYKNYYQMLSDEVRMKAYKEAIFKVVNAGDVVVDLGVGTGLLSVWAIQAGASKVYAIEKTEAIHLAQDVARSNGCADQIVFINKNSAEVELPEKADVLLSETLGSFGVDENTLQFTKDAKDRFLKEEGRLIPQKIDLYMAPVSCEEVYRKLDFWRHIEGVDFTPAFELFSRKIMIETIPTSSLLSAPMHLSSIDLYNIENEHFSSRAYVQMEKAGVLHGVAGWFEVDLCEGVSISTSPSSEPTHWQQAFFPFTQSIEVVVADVLDWSVEVKAKSHQSDDALISYEYRCTQLKNES